MFFASSPRIFEILAEIATIPTTTTRIMQATAPRGPRMPSMSGRFRRVVRALLPFALIALILYVVISLAGGIDWSEVGHALGRMSPLQLSVLVLALLVRQLLNALPLSLYIDGVSPLRALQNDQTAILMTTVAPPPADVVMRLAMFTSWGVSVPKAMAGTVMNTLSFYVIRFGAPLLGVVLMIVTGTLDVAELVPALLSALVSVAILVAIWSAFRDRDLAARMGRRAGRAAHRVRSSVDPEAWAASTVTFRDAAVGKVRTALPRSLLALTAMVCVDALIIVAAIRFVGISPAMLGVVPVLTAFLTAYPLTLFPASGLGLLDSVVIATLVLHVGVDAEPELVAAFIVWRAVTLLTPLALGGVSLLAWKVEMIRKHA